MKNVLLILVVIIIIFVFSNKQMYMSENFTNICWSLQSSYSNNILKENNKLINNLGLKDYVNVIIEPLIKTNTIDKKITLEKYLIDKKIPTNKLNAAIILINIIVNNNCMISSLIEYDIKGNSLLFDIVSCWKIDTLRNSMLCVINDKKVIDDLIKQLLLVIISPRISLCNKDEFQKYCEKSYENYMKEIKPKVKVETRPKVENKKSMVESKARIEKRFKKLAETESEFKVEVVNKKQLEKFGELLDNTKKNIQTGSNQIMKVESKILPLVSTSPKFMDIHSLSDHLEKFNSKSFGPALEPNMNKILLTYKQKNKKDFNILDKKDFGKLIIILIDEIKLVITNIVDEDDFTKLKPLINQFNNLQRIFYLLKHNYKLLLAYELINTKIQKSDQKLQAQLCCSKTSEKSCFNFSANPKQSSAIIYGFNDLGYIQSAKCMKDDENSKKLVKEQNMTINELFNDKYAAWRNLSKENKLQILANVLNCFLLFGIKLNKIDGKIIDLRNQMENSKIKISLSDFDMKIPIKPGKINQKFIINNPEYKKMIDEIKKIDKVEKLNEFIKILGFHDYVLFNNTSDIAYSKNILEALATIKEVFKNFGANNTIQIAKLLSLIKTQESFFQIMRNTVIIPRYHQLVVDFILKTLSDKKIAVIRNNNMNSIPDKTILYLQSILSSKDLNYCNISEDFLIQLRKDRSITNEEFNKYLKQSYLVCNPNKVQISDIKSITIPINRKKGLAVVDRKYKSYFDFFKEGKEIDKNNLKSKVVSSNILFNTIKNTYN